MGSSVFHFQGYADIYLQGENALEPANGTGCRMSYFLGSPASRILVHDHREKPAKAAVSALNGYDDNLFAEVFSQSGWIVIRSEENFVEIEIFEGQTIDGNIPTLWLGVISDGKMAVNDIEWEILMPVSMTQIAFAALVR